MVDVITKFTYLEHGKAAPKNSSFNGVISTSSIIGFKQYGERKAAKELSQEATLANDKATFFDYTSKRIGATQTYSSIGWIDSKEKNDVFKNEISRNFNKDGDLLWVPVISLRDYMTSTDLKLFNEKDYAAVFDKILPSWFSRSGFNKDNMVWWMDHHVNTDNPHIHLCFLEKEKTKNTGKIPMKHINDFKAKFWQEVFSKKRFLEETGKGVEDNFKYKDVLKKETLEQFKEQFKKCSNQEFINLLKDLYKDIPSTGRLQYNSVHMIPFRDRLDNLVNVFLRTPGVSNKYQEFVNCLKNIDSVRSKSLNTSFNNVFIQEDKKLKVQLANFILKEYKEADMLFHQDVLEKEQEIENNFIYIPVAKSLVKDIDERNFFCRIPGTGNYIKIEKENNVFITKSKNMNIFKLNVLEAYELHNSEGAMLNEKIEVEDLHNYFSDGLDYIAEYEKILDRHKSFQHFNKEWVTQNYDWNGLSRKAQRASFSWMNQIEKEVQQAQDEYFNGRESGLSV